jgi:hypothetical protein
MPGPVSGMPRTRAGHVWYSRARLVYRPDVSSRCSASSSALAALSTWPAAQGSGPGGLGAGPHGGLPDTVGRRTPLYTGGGALVGALASDQRVVPAAVAVVSGCRRGSGTGGTGAWTGGIGASSPGGAGASPAGASGDPVPGGAEGATITAPTNVTSSSVRKAGTRTGPRSSGPRGSLTASAVRLWPARSPTVSESFRGVIPTLPRLPRAERAFAKFAESSLPPPRGSVQACPRHRYPGLRHHP